MNKQAWLATIMWRSPRLRARLLRWRVALARLGGRASAALAGPALAVTLGVGGVAPGGAASGGERQRTDPIMVAAGEVAVNDNGLCSLIEAIHNANDTATGSLYADCAPGNPNPTEWDTIALPPSSVFTLTAADNTTYGRSGLPVITSQVTISGSYTSTIERDPTAEPFRVLAVGREGALSLESTWISGGQAATQPERAASVDYAAVGGGVLNLGQLSLSHAVISGNTANVGGGVYNAGRLIGSNPTLKDNSAPYGGSALFSFGEANMVDIDVRQNGGGAFGAAVENEGVMLLSGGYIRDNGSPAGLGNRGQATIYGLKFENEGGTAVASTGGELLIEGATISGHKTGIANTAAAVVSRTAIIDNGRGIVNGRGEMTLVNSTISGNKNEGDGGGILVTGGAVRGQFNTVTNNQAARGGGVYVTGFYSLYNDCVAGWMALENSILSGNTAATGPEAYVRQDSFRCLGHLYLDGSFVGHDGEHGTVRAILGQATVPDEALAAIITTQWTYSAGWNPHHTLPWGSPAVDALPDEACELPAPSYATDQLWHERNVDGDYRPSARECDAGAVERQLLPYNAFAPFAAHMEAQP